MRPNDSSAAFEAPYAASRGAPLAAVEEMFTIEPLSPGLDETAGHFAARHDGVAQVAADQPVEGIHVVLGAAVPVVDERAPDDVDEMAEPAELAGQRTDRLDECGLIGDVEHSSRRIDPEAGGELDRGVGVFRDGRDDADRCAGPGDQLDDGRADPAAAPTDDQDTPTGQVDGDAHAKSPMCSSEIDTDGSGMDAPRAGGPPFVVPPEPGGRHVRQQQGAALAPSSTVSAAGVQHVDSSGCMTAASARTV